MSAPPASAVRSEMVSESKTHLADYCLWQEPETDTRIYLKVATAERLQIEVLRGRERFPGGEAEVGGILIGRTEMDDEGTLTLIDDFVPVACSYESGSRYCLSGNDIVNFQAALAESSATRGLSVLGYYRSHNRDDLYLSTDDLTLIHRFFPEEDKVFLVIKTLPSRACTAGFFFWEDGHIQSEFTYLEVPLSPVQSFPSAELTRPPKVTTNEAPAAVDRNLPPEVPGVGPLELSESSRQGRPVWLGLAAALVVVVVTLAAYSYWRTRQSRQPQIPTPVAAALGLQVGRKADALAVMWDRNSREVAAAKRGALSIRDGVKQETLQLDESQLRNGVVSYTPSGDDIQFRLEVYREGKPGSVESIHLLMPAARVLTNEAGTPGLPRREEDPAQGSSSHINAKTASTAKKHEKAMPLLSSSESSSSPRPVQFVAPPRSISRVSSVPSMNDLQLDLPPSVPFETKPSELIFASAAVRPEAPPPPKNRVQPELAQPPTTQAEPPATRDALAMSGNAGSSRPAGSGFVGPRVIQQVNPSIPLDLRSKITSDVHIDVAVTIDVNGKVTDAKITSLQGGVARFISGQVLQAARLFQFRPAQENNKNVDSKMILTFRFSSGQRNEKSTK